MAERVFEGHESANGSATVSWKNPETPGYSAGREVDGMCIGDTPRNPVKYFQVLAGQLRGGSSPLIRTSSLPTDSIASSKKGKTQLTQ